MKEIGGYIEYETYYGKMLHDDGILLNCGRSCIAYLIKTRNIKKVLLPYFMCDSVFNVFKRHNVQIRYYQVNKELRPQDVEIENDEWLYLMNYYGQLTDKEIVNFKIKYKRVIVDYTHNYFGTPINGLDTIYTCRKFFGVSDGAILYTDVDIADEFEMDESHNRMHYLLGRYEKGASEFYAESAQNNVFFENEPIKRMSRLTANLLKGIDYERVKTQRTKNFEYLYKHLKNMNELSVNIIEGAFAYPLMIKNGDIIRKKLAEQGIYVPTLWPNVIELPKDMMEYYYAKNILPLPCDQRYNEEDMMRVVDTVILLVREYAG